MKSRYFLKTFIIVLGVTAFSSAVQATGSITQTLRLKAERQKNNKYITLNGSIPDICKEKVAINFSCQNPNKVVYKLREMTDDGFKCLQDYQSRCGDSASKKECVTLEKLSKNKNLKDNFIITFDKKTDEASCKDVSIGVATVEIIKQSFNAKRANTEAGACLDCMMAQKDSNRDSFGPEKQVQNLKKIVMDNADEEDDAPPVKRERPSMPSGNMNMRGGMNMNSGDGSSANYLTMLSSALSSVMMMQMYSNNRSNYYSNGYYGYNNYSPYSSYMMGGYSSYPYYNTGYSYPYSNYSNYTTSYNYPYSVYGTSNYLNNTNFTLPTTYNATTYGGR